MSIETKTGRGREGKKQRSEQRCREKQRPEQRENERSRDRNRERERKKQRPGEIEIWSHKTSVASSWGPDMTTFPPSLSSGNNRGNHAMSSTLEFSANFLLKTGNRVRFSYTVEAERQYDGLSFLIDDIEVMPMVSFVSGWAVATFNISAGYHRLAWVFSKDTTIELGADRARIRSIELLGTRTATENACVRCPVGTFSGSARTSVCQPCPWNTAASLAGTQSCRPCDPGFFAPPGSSECRMMLNCTVDDYVVASGACNEQTGMRDVTYNPVIPFGAPGPVCVDTGAVRNLLPAQVPCDCPAGKQPSKTGSCEFCPAGSSSRGGLSACTPCTAGTAAFPQLGWKNWYELPATFATACIGDCSGWTPAGTFLRCVWSVCCVENVL
jgi:hypothetical protein